MQCRSDLCERADPTHLPKAQPPELQRVRRKAVFHPGTEPLELIGVHGIPVGVSICEDIWIDDGPHVDLVNLGAELIVTINGSPYHLDKDSELKPSSLSAPPNFVFRSGTSTRWVAKTSSSLTVDHSSLMIQVSSLLEHLFTESLLVVDIDITDRDTRVTPNISLNSSTPPPQRVQPGGDRRFDVGR